MKRLWIIMTNAGVHATLDTLLIKRIKLTNQISTSIAAVAFLYCFIFYFNGLESLSAITAISATLLLSIVWMNRSGWYSASRMAFLFILNILMLLHCVYMGFNTSMYLNYFEVACMPWLLFELKDWKRILLGILMSIGMFYYYILVQPAAVTPVSGATGLFLSFSFTILVFLFCGLCLMFLSYQNDVSETSLKESNTNLNLLLGELYDKNKRLETQQQLKELNEALSLQAKKLLLYQHDLKSTLEQKEIINQQLTRFTYMVAHDLKSPLSGITGLLGLLKMNTAVTTSAELTEIVNTMESSSSHLSQMIKAILDYSHKTNNFQAVERVDTHELVEQIVRLLFAPPHITISIDGKLPRLTTNPFKLHQVFQNLISNAIKHHDKPKGEIHIGYLDDGSFYKFYVRDDGPGVDDREREKVFKLFSTTANHEKDGGVGLNITKALVEEQGGQVSLESERGIGSTFYFQWMKENSPRVIDTQPVGA